MVNPDPLIAPNKIAAESGFIGQEGINLTKEGSLLCGTRKRVRISGYELWKIDNDGLIAESKGHFDAAEYEHQLKHGAGN